MSVALDPPSQLIFKRPLTQPIEEILYVKNVGNEPLAFKVKTTAPKKYCVRPNSSIIEPGSHVELFFNLLEKNLHQIINYKQQ
ncbi:unnamed protein product [Cunninghamella echinulata]